LKCPECCEELVRFWATPLVKLCKRCGIEWVIMTLEQSTQMGLLNNEMLARTDLSMSEKIKMLEAKQRELFPGD